MTDMPPKNSPVHFAKRILIAGHPYYRWLIPDRYSSFSVPGGKIFLNLHESPMMLQRALGVYEPQKVGAVQRLMPRGGTFIDIGGNKGDFALLAAKIAGAGSRVICVEPEPTNASWIRKSVALNNYNIEVHEMALSDGKGDAVLHLGKMSGFHTILDGVPNHEQVGAVTVKLQTLDALLSERGIDRVDLIKIDVEGAEMKVLRGATQTLSRNQNLTLLLDVHPHLGVNPDEVVSFLSSHGFHIYRMGDTPQPVHPPCPDLRELMATRNPPNSRSAQARTPDYTAAPR
jgi:FkbM family methyltransferase